MDDKGGLSLTPSSALRDEVAKRVLKIWQNMRAGSSEISDLRNTVVDAKSQGVDFLSEHGSGILGPELPDSPALRSELEAADRAYLFADEALSAGSSNLAQVKVAIDGLLAREASNPYAPVALDHVSAGSPQLSSQIRSAKEQRGSTRAADGELVLAEREAISLGRAQVRAAVSSKARVLEERDELASTLKQAFSSSEQVLRDIEQRAFAQDADPADLDRDLRTRPGNFGEVRDFKSGWLQREDVGRKSVALAAVARAFAEYVATVQHYTSELRNAEFEITQQQAAGIPAPSRDLNDLLKQTPPGSNLFSGITQEDRRDRLVSEAQTLATQIGQRVDANGAKGLAPQLAARLRDVQARLKSSVTVNRARTQALEHKREGPELSC